MISRKDTHRWFDIVMVALDNIARAESNKQVLVQIDHVIDIGNCGRESICFRVSWQGGPHGCIRTDEDMDREAEGIARVLPVRCWFGEPDEVKRCEALPHAFDSYVYIK